MSTASIARPPTPAQQRAATIALTPDAIRWQTGSIVSVASQTSPRQRYTVRLSPTGNTCTCKAAQHGGDCKHILACRAISRAQLIARQHQHNGTLLAFRDHLLSRMIAGPSTRFEADTLHILFNAATLLADEPETARTESAVA